jgi:hypothetical protein
VLCNFELQCHISHHLVFEYDLPSLKLCVREVDCGFLLCTMCMYIKQVVNEKKNLEEIYFSLTICVLLYIVALVCLWVEGGESLRYMFRPTT